MFISYVAHHSLSISLDCYKGIGIYGKDSGDCFASFCPAARYLKNTGYRTLKWTTTTRRKGRKPPAPEMQASA